MHDTLIAGFAQPPFSLDQSAQKWVTDTFETLQNVQKARLLFSQMTMGPVLDLEELAAVQPGFITRMGSGEAEDELQQLEKLNALLDIPVGYCADLEGSMTVQSGSTPAPNPMALAAANDPALTKRAVRALASEARGFGIRWSFTPAIDLNIAFRSAVVGTRSYGSDQETVQAQGLATLAGLTEAGIAATVKHWPGEATDQRDQHLVTTINDLSFADWQASFGTMYRAAIDAGAMTVMSAHIALPSYMKDVVGVSGPEAFLPASLNVHLNEGLLRDTLGFKGLIVSDATPMAGMSGVYPRSELVVNALMAGCDVLLGAQGLEQDADFILAGLADGRVTQDRLDTAILRQLAMKAALGLHIRPNAGAPEQIDTQPIHEVMKKAPTLVKARDGLLPITPERYKRIYVVSRGVGFPPASSTEPLPLAFKGMMKEAGFEVVEHIWGTPVDPTGCDLLLYVYAEETLLTRGTITNEWGAMNGNFVSAMSRHWHDTPTFMISFGWPYHMYEAPGVWGYANAYMSHPAMQSIMLDAMMGKQAFEGTSPIDPFCGIDPDYFDLPIGNRKHAKSRL
ncbi:beta-N-acetylhexosaminidase [Pacificibacter maritimus]|uniref:beta-N-acetylhexosaminidase n=1 Tax=Pacificibacter maritimus TaxID=762213 RepID=A0A3N4UMB0_9RHOB|nr:glycoside hydrolase family 3 N-terminal domain-containing protein [Pacificibacter maritimus]RPE71593.1 beta-N-acetylhexosaminidase [Pacificibacter maritimus]